MLSYKVNQVLNTDQQNKREKVID